MGHAAPLAALRFTPAKNLVVSIDKKGEAVFKKQLGSPKCTSVVCPDFFVTTTSAAFVLLSGMIEYWSASNYQFPSRLVAFQYKTETDLFALAKAKTVARSLEISPDGAQFVCFCSDRYAL